MVPWKDAPVVFSIPAEEQVMWPGKANDFPLPDGGTERDTPRDRAEGGVP